MSKQYVPLSFFFFFKYISIYIKLPQLTYCYRAVKKLINPDVLTENELHYLYNDGKGEGQGGITYTRY